MKYIRHIEFFVVVYILNIYEEYIQDISSNALAIYVAYIFKYTENIFEVYIKIHQQYVRHTSQNIPGIYLRYIVKYISNIFCAIFIKIEAQLKILGDFEFF